MEIRGVDIHPVHLFGTDPDTGPRKVGEIVNIAAEHNLNFLRPFVVGTRCDASYDSEIVPIKLFQGWDPLELLIGEAHTKGLEVHPFVCVVPQGVGDTEKPGNLGPVLKEHPEWAMVNRDGEPIGWGNPAHPGFRAYAVRVITEIVGNYDVDGISLDYGRYPGTQVGYSEHNRNAFKEQYGVDPINIPQEDPLYPQWNQWRIAQVDQLIREIHDAVKAARPEVVLSAYVWTTRDPQTCLRNWEDWIRKGYMNAINPSGYVYSYSEYISRCESGVKAAKAIRPDIPVFINIGVHTSHGQLKNAPQVIKWIQGARKAGANGFSFFTMSSLLPYIDEVTEAAFPDKAQTPFR